jgi:integrase
MASKVRKGIRTKVTADDLKNKTARLGLDIQGKPYWVSLSVGLFIGYRRCEGPGRWLARDAGGKVAKFALADDREEANGAQVMNWEQAQNEARRRVRDSDGQSIKTILLEDALATYKNNLAERGADPRNESTVHKHLRRVAPLLLRRDVNALTTTELLAFRTKLLAAGMKHVTWNRVSKGLHAALMLVAEERQKIWDKGVETLEDDREPGELARNVVLTEGEVSRLVRGCYEHDHAFGLLMDVLSVTGARPGQATRLLVSNLHLGPKPTLSMPRSAKGGGGKNGRKRAAKKKQHVTVAIPVGLAERLAAVAKGRKPNEYLLRRGDGMAWEDGSRAHGECRRLLLKAVLEAIDLVTNSEGEKVTAYALRHTSITRAVLANKSLRVIAEAHDTSVQEIEDHYTQGILKHADEIMREGLVDHGNVVTFPKAA